MDKNNIFILTGPIHSGKTTRLLKWSLEFERVNGILTPVRENKRMFQDVQSGDLFAMEASEREENILKIGKYNFSHDSFLKAEKIIADGMKNNPSYLVIDEIGPLELRGEGFANILKEILKIDKRNFNLVLVIRDSILSEVMNYFNIKEYQLLNI